MQIRRNISIVLVCISTAAASAEQTPRPNAEAERAQLHYRLGWESLRSEAFEAAVKEFQQAIDLSPKFALAYCGLGKAHMGLHRYPNAVAAFEACRDFYVAKAGEKFSGQFDANRQRQDRIMELQELARQSRQGPQTQGAQDQQRQIQNAIRQTNDETMRGNNVNIDGGAPAFISLALGSAYFRAQRLADAEREYKATIDVDPKAGEAHNNLAVVYMLTGRLAESAKELGLAEKAGYRVNPQLKEDLNERRKQ